MTRRATRWTIAVATDEVPPLGERAGGPGRSADARDADGASETGTGTRRR